MNRSPLRPMAPEEIWTRIDIVAETGSTNADLAAAPDAADGTVLVAEWQNAGRGRLGRVWSAPPRSGLFLSVMLRPPAHGHGGLGWLPLVTGVAVAAAIRGTGGVEAALKWPNDVLAGERKLGGILAERLDNGAVVIGMGVNVSLRDDELPVPTATSIELEGGHGDRDALLRAILRELAARYTDWASGKSARADYLRRCATLGREVRVELPAGRELTGTAVDVNSDGCLVVRTPGGTRPVSAGDVVHVR